MRPFLPVLFFFCLVTKLDGLPTVIRIGGLFSADEEEQELTFRFAVEKINADRSLILPRSTLVAHVERIGREDSFHAHKKVCGLLRNEVVAIFGPSSAITSMHVQSICDALEIPHVETRWDYQLKRQDLSINLYPRPAILARAFIDLIKTWQWKSFAIVYEQSEEIIGLQEFFKSENKDLVVKLYQFSYDKPFRDAFWEVKKGGETNIVLDVSRENLYLALKHAQQVGMLTDIHNYLITSLDLHTIDLEDFKFGKTKITAFRLVDTTSLELQNLFNDWDLLGSRLGRTGATKPENIKTETALIYDAVKLLSAGLQDLDRSQAVTIEPISCDNGNPWQHGSSLINYMRPITFRGVTGFVGFDQSGFRTNVQLDLTTLYEKEIQKIGTWSEISPAGNNLNMSDFWLEYYSSLGMQNKTLIVTTVINPPYTMLKETAHVKWGNDRFEGYTMDLIEELAQILGFRYTFRLVSDGKYGSKDPKTGKWNGMIAELINGVADIAIVDLTITSKREEAVDFTLPFMNTGISILYKKPLTKETSLFSFLAPFSIKVWIYMFGAYIGVSVVLFIVGRLTPYEWDNPHPCRQEDQVLENEFNLLNSLWFTIGSIMQQGTDIAPKTMSTRTIAGIWYFFTLIIISSYTANLAAFLTVEKVVYPIENAEQLANQDKIKYGCLEGGSTNSFFEESSVPVFRKMAQFMNNNPSVYVKSNTAGIERVESDDGKYAYLMESASIEYIIERQCNLTQIGGLLDSKGYGIATRKGSKYRTPLSQAILSLQEKGVLHQIKDRWWKQKKGGGACTVKASGGVTELSLANVGGVFVVLIAGLAVAFLFALCEFVWKTYKNSDKESFWEDLARDFKFALNCQISTKPVHKKPNGSQKSAPQTPSGSVAPNFPIY